MQEEKKGREKNPASVKGVLVERQPLNEAKITDLLEKAEELDKRYTDYQVKIRVAEDKAKNIQGKGAANSDRLKELQKNFQLTAEWLKQEKDKAKSLVFMNLKKEIMSQEQAVLKVLVSEDENLRWQEELDKLDSELKSNKKTIDELKHDIASKEAQMKSLNDSLKSTGNEGQQLKADLTAS